MHEKSSILGDTSLISHLLFFIDEGQKKPGSCPKNAPDRDYFLGRECRPGGDFDCFGVQKCGQAPHGPAHDMHCVDPEPM